MGPVKPPVIDMVVVVSRRGQPSRADRAARGRRGARSRGFLTCSGPIGIGIRGARNFSNAEVVSSGLSSRTPVLDPLVVNASATCGRSSSSHASTRRAVGRPTGGLNAELLCVLRVQSLPAAELHGLGADDASNRLTREEPLKDVEADVPARGAPRDEAAIDVVPEREARAAAERFELPPAVVATPAVLKQPRRLGPL